MEEVKRRRRRSSRKLPAKMGRELEARKSIRMPQITFPKASEFALEEQPHNSVLGCRLRVGYGGDVKNYSYFL